MDRIQTELCLSSIVGIFRRPFYSCCISRFKTFPYDLHSSLAVEVQY
jgi:hypothetical protein